VPRTLAAFRRVDRIVLDVLVYILLMAHTHGYRIRAVGLNPNASRYAGIPVRSTRPCLSSWAVQFAGWPATSRRWACSTA
jgi:simple sugar transport system permease protein